MDAQILVQTSLDNFFTKYPDIQEQSSYAVAVSGGPDSMALLHALFDWVLAQKKELHVLTVDHGLREAAKAEADQVAHWVQEQNSDLISHQTLLWEGDKPGSAIMEEARMARYKLMAAYCLEQKIATIFVAHHQDDQAETFLIRLAKGSGLDGLAAIGTVQNYDETLKIARPFLDVPKQDLINYCQSNDIDFVVDPSNENVNYLRPRLRKSMLILEEEGLSVKRLSTLTRRLRRARCALEEITEKSYADCLQEKSEQLIVLDFKKFKHETEEIAFRILHKSVQDIRGVDGYGVRMDRLESLFASLWYNEETFKPRTLGGLIFALKDKNSALYIGIEHADKE